MARGRTPLPTRYDPEAVKSANEMATKQFQYAKDVQRRQEASRRDNAVTAIGKNTPAYLQPPGGMHAGMSRADQDAAVARATGAPLVAPPQFNFGAKGGTSAVPWTGGSIAQKLAPGAAETVSRPAPTSADIAPHGSGPGGRVMNGSEAAANLAQTRALIAPHDPSQAPRQPSAESVLASHDAAVANQATRTAAGTGNVVQTPYGTASSRQLNWQEQIVKAHPEIGVKDSPENKAFLQQYNQAKTAGSLNADGSPKDHMALAGAAIDSVRSAANQPKGGNAADLAAKDQASSPGFTGEKAQGADQVTPKTIGQNIAKVPGVIGDALTSVPKAVIGAAGNLADKIGTAGGQLYSGITGNPSPYVPGSVPADLNSMGQGVGMLADAAKATLVGGSQPAAPAALTQGGASVAPAQYDPSSYALGAAQAHADAFHKSVTPLFKSAAAGVGGYSPPPSGYAGTQNDVGPVAPTPTNMPTGPTPAPTTGMDLPPVNIPTPKTPDTANY